MMQGNDNPSASFMDLLQAWQLGRRPQEIDGAGGAVQMPYLLRQAMGQGQGTPWFSALTYGGNPFSNVAAWGQRGPGVVGRQDPTAFMGNMDLSNWSRAQAPNLRDNGLMNTQGSNWSPSSFGGGLLGMKRR